MTKKKTPSPNDQRANTKNPNNPAHKADRDNRSRQLNPQDPTSGQRQGEGPDKAPSKS